MLQLSSLFFLLLFPSSSSSSFIYLFIVIIILCFFPWQAIQVSFRVEEITNFCHRQMKKEERRRNVAVKAFNVAEKRIN